MGEPGGVRVQEEMPGFVRLQVDRDTAGWLVALQSFYPGWKATVNGRPATLARANVAFTALHVGPGANEVLLEYDPLSVKIGLAITTAAGLLVILLAALRSRSASLVAAGGQARAPGADHAVTAVALGGSIERHQRICTLADDWHHQHAPVS